MSRLVPTMDLKDFSNIYFVGIGGIGMSALARYFNALGFRVAGYDKTKTKLTESLVEEGIEVHFDDLADNIPAPYNNREETLVIYTPAIPKSLHELNFFQREAFIVLKRSEVLGLITMSSKGLGVAGTHGKTTTSSMLAYLLEQSEVGCSAFLGGIATNFNSNLVLNTASSYTVIEADEFDRSFLQLHPYCSIVTSTDPDHLDIYGSREDFLNGFQDYVNLIHPDGCLVVREGLALVSPARKITYAINSETADYSAYDLRVEAGEFVVDIRTPKKIWTAVTIGIPGIHNAENALACVALCEFLDIPEDDIRLGLKQFRGVKRRFEYIHQSAQQVYIDDYAHHPTELAALIDSVKLLYPNKRITGIFQPHLFSRTKDFFDGFAEQLSRLDEVILMPIYPAREEPIPGVTSDALLAQITIESKRLVESTRMVETIKEVKPEVLLTIGAGDIDRLIQPLKALLS